MQEEDQNYLGGKILWWLPSKWYSTVILEIGWIAEWWIHLWNPHVLNKYQENETKNIWRQKWPMVDRALKEEKGYFF